MFYKFQQFSRSMIVMTGVVALGGAMLTANVGCESTQRASPLVTDYDPADVDGQLDFWHGLAEEPVTTNSDAMHGLIEMANQTDPFTTYQERLDWLKEAGYLDASFDEPADQAVRRGTVAQVVCRILKIKGGVSMHLVGAHPRYATRELVYMKIMKPGTENQALSGIQFVGTISRAQEYAMETEQ